MAPERETSEPNSQAAVAFDDATMKAERKKQKKKPTKLSKSSKPQAYHHTPICAAQSFAITTTPDPYSKRQAHRSGKTLGNPAITRKTGAPAALNLDERSSSECERSSLKTPPSDGSRRSPLSAPSTRFSQIEEPAYELFSSSILQNGSGNIGRSVTPTTDSFTKGKVDWSENDERMSGGLRRMASMASTRSSKSKQSRRHSSDFSNQMKGNTVLRVPSDNESIYQGRGCLPWRPRIHVS